MFRRVTETCWWKIIICNWTYLYMCIGWFVMWMCYRRISNLQKIEREIIPAYPAMRYGGLSYDQDTLKIRKGLYSKQKPIKPKIMNLKLKLHLFWVYILLCYSVSAVDKSHVLGNCQWWFFISFCRIIRFTCPLFVSSSWPALQLNFLTFLSILHRISGNLMYFKLKLKKNT